MKIQNQTHVSIDYTLTLKSGEVADKSEPGKPLSFMYGSGQIIPGLEKALEGRTAGEDLSIDVPAKDAYGEKSNELLQELPRTHFPDDVEVAPGMIFQSPTPHGTLRFRVEKVTDDTITADLNHPLAGEDLHFDVKVVTVREATEEEIKQAEHPQCDGTHNCESCSG